MYRRHGHFGRNDTILGRHFLFHQHYSFFDSACSSQCSSTVMMEKIKNLIYVIMSGVSFLVALWIDGLYHNLFPMTVAALSRNISVITSITPNSIFSNLSIHSTQLKYGSLYLLVSFFLSVSLFPAPPLLLSLSLLLPLSL